MPWQYAETTCRISSALLCHTHTERWVVVSLLDPLADVGFEDLNRAVDCGVERGEGREIVVGRLRAAVWGARAAGVKFRGVREATIGQAERTVGDRVNVPRVRGKGQGW
jgi:hypothetical protein